MMLSCRKTVMHPTIQMRQDLFEFLCQYLCHSFNYANYLCFQRQRFRMASNIDLAVPNSFWATICKTFRPVLSDRCLSCLSVSLSVCNIGVLWPNGWMDQDTTWYSGRPRPRRHCVRWRPSSLTERGTVAPTLSFRPCLFWPNSRPSQQLLSSC